MRLLSSTLLAASLTAAAACSGGPPGSTTPRGSMQDDRTMLADLNAAARSGATTETIHGRPVHDPFRALEIESDTTRAWVDAQSARTERALASLARPERAERLDALLKIGTIGDVQVGGARIFFTKREGDREQPQLFVTGAGDAQPRALVDPSTHGERAALDWYYASPAGTYVAFGISQNGDERSTLHVLEVESGRVLEDEITHTKWTNVAWLESERGFFYTRYPKEGEDGFDPEHEDTYWPRIFFHTLGADASEDRAFTYARNAERTDFPAPSVSDDDHFAVVNHFRGWSASDVYVIDRQGPRHTLGDAPTPAPQTIVAGRESLTSAIPHRRKLFMLTNIDAPKYRVVVVDDPFAARATAEGIDPARWRTIIPEAEAAIETFTVAGDHVFVHYVDDVRSRVRIFTLEGVDAGEIELPTRGSVEGLAASKDGRTLAFSFSSFFFPPTLFRYDVASRALTRVDQVHSDIDVSRYELSQERVPSADGTLINVYYVHRRGLERNGQNPVLINGYGGFNVSLLPTFTRHALYWLERGGIFAVANLRGGAEYGEAWHQGGNLLNKIKVFEDFEAVIRWFSSSGISQPSKIGITGGSNGGLLMGALLTRAPDAFGAATTYVGLYDMIRFHLFPPAELWVTEYGSADDAAQFEYLLSYSPYHQVRAGVHYPATLVETADHDSRVYWGHSTKFAARLQEAQAGDAPIYFYMERAVGHGAGTRRSDLVNRYVRSYTFLENTLGVAP